MSNFLSLENIVRARIATNAKEIRHSLKMAMEGRPRAAENEVDRLVARLVAEKSISFDEARKLASVIMRKPGGQEVIQGDTVDFDGVYFFHRGLRASRSVARVRTPTGFGSGFMVSSELFVTNNHVIESAASAAHSVIEFDVEEQEDGNLRAATVFRLDPDKFFCTDGVRGLDFTLVAVGPRQSGAAELGSFGYCELSDAANKHSLGEMANIIQHPGGKPKQVVIRENRLAARTDSMLHYLADTQPGSSGSPVFNGQWQVIALHHFGGPSATGMRDLDGKIIPRTVNEGVRASAIVGFLKDKAGQGEFSSEKRSMLQRGLNQEPWRGPQVVSESGGAGVSTAVTLSQDGTATWRMPIEISVRLPLPQIAQPEANQHARQQADSQLDYTGGIAEALKPDANYASRKGYDPKFLGVVIALPLLSKTQKSEAARNSNAEDGDDLFELKYQHFSVVMNGKRRLAYFTACNIDGKTALDLKRKESSAYSPESAEARHIAKGQEATESWYLDPRIDQGEQTPQCLYESQITPDGAAGGHTANIFQRGHLVRRLDPVWGRETNAKAAEADTFHFTNCAPQIGFFNMGKGNKSLPGSSGGRLWRALEDYVLDNAKAEAKRICVFTGPVFGKRDIAWRQDIIPGFKVPLKFWKIVVWQEADQLRARAMLADQSIALPKVLPEILLPEDFDDTEPVSDFIVSVAEIEKLTGLRFSAALKRADLGKAQKRPREVRRASELLNLD